VPDITNKQVQINTVFAALSPIEVEKQLTFPIETTLAGIPGLVSTRSLSRNGFSQVTAVFRDDVDIYSHGNRSTNGSPGAASLPWSGTAHGSHLHGPGRSLHVDRRICTAPQRDDHPWSTRLAERWGLPDPRRATTHRGARARHLSADRAGLDHSAAAQGPGGSRRHRCHWRLCQAISCPA
jgi:hypothetical protein